MVLVDGGADVDLEDYNGATPIINACRANQHVMATFLLERNADPNRQTKVISNMEHFPLLKCHSLRAF